MRTTGGNLRWLSTATLDLPLYPWIHTAPDGRAFYAGPTQTMRALDTSGTGAWQSLGQRDPIDRSYGSHALFDVGKMLVAGGDDSRSDARVIDLNGPTPQVSATAPMENGRRQHNLTVLADGGVLATGGNYTGSGLVDLNGGVYTPELWNPATGTWTTLAAEQATRQYHSTALLLPDGRVLSSGGGICGACDELGYLAKNGQVFTPPYLYKRTARASSRRARRSPVRPPPSSTPQLPDRHPQRRRDPQGRARPSGRSHALGQYGAALRAAVLHRRDRLADRDRAREPQHRAARRLHAVHHRRRRRALGRQDGDLNGADPPPPPPPPNSGLVGAWGFGEGTGGTTADASGKGNVGTITGATWTPRAATATP